MPSNPPYLSPIAQLPMAEAGQLLLIGVAMFVLITLIASMVRFHRMLELDESELGTPEQCDDFFFVQVTRFVSKISRSANGFTLLLLQFRTHESDVRSVQSQVFKTLSRVVRRDEDPVSPVHTDCIGVLINTDEDHTERAATRLAASLEPLLRKNPDVTGWRIGISTFPLHGPGSQALIDNAEKALSEAGWDPSDRVRIAPPPEDAIEEGGGEPGETPREELSRSSTIDPLTGVLKPRVTGSYMRKYLAELRQKKRPACVLCIETNRLDQIRALHGETAVDEVLVTVSQILQRLTRDADLIGRLDGGLFIVLAPCELGDGERIAKRLREAVQKETIAVSGRRIKTSISVGISAYPDHGRLMRELAPRAMDALNTVRSWKTSACLVYGAHTKTEPGQINPVENG